MGDWWPGNPPGPVRVDNKKRCEDCISVPAPFFRSWPPLAICENNSPTPVRHIFAPPYGRARI